MLFFCVVQIFSKYLLHFVFRDNFLITFIILFFFAISFGSLPKDVFKVAVKNPFFCLILCLENQIIVEFLNLGCTNESPQRCHLN